MRTISLLFATFFISNISNGQMLDTTENFQKALYYLNKPEKAIQILEEIKINKENFKDSAYLKLVFYIAESYILQQEIQDSKEDYLKFEKETKEGWALKMFFPTYRRGVALKLAKFGIQQEDYQYALVFLNEFHKNLGFHYCLNGWGTDDVLFRSLRAKCFAQLNETDSLIACGAGIMFNDFHIGQPGIDTPRIKEIEQIIVENLILNFTIEERKDILRKALESIHVKNHGSAEIVILNHPFHLFDVEIINLKYYNKDFSQREEIQFYKNRFLESSFYKELSFP